MFLFCSRFIDSQVFAEEVEPTGAVPIEMSLERYRYAALPNKFKEMSDDQRLQPRVMLKFFSGSHILSQVNILLVRENASRIDLFLSDQNFPT